MTFNYKKLILLFVSIFAIVITGCGKETTTYQNHVKVINQNYDTKIFLYGNDMEFNYNFKYQKINSFYECVSSSEYNYIIFNYYNLFSLSDYELNKLQQLLHEKHYKILYVNLNYYLNNLKNLSQTLIFKDQDYSEVKICLIDFDYKNQIISEDQGQFIILDFIISNIKDNELRKSTKVK